MPSALRKKYINIYNLTRTYTSGPYPLPKAIVKMPPKNVRSKSVSDGKQTVHNTRKTSKETQQTTQKTYMKDLGAVDCIVCNKTFTGEDDKLLQCERCNSWECLACVGYSTEEYEMLTKRPKVHWFCDPCQSPALYAVQTDNEIEERCNHYLQNFTSRISKLEEEMELKASKVDLEHQAAQLLAVKASLVEKGHTLEQDIDNKVEEKLSEYERERKEREKRKANLIVYKIPEPTSEEPEERKKEDTAKIAEILEQLELPDIELKNVVRLNTKAEGASNSVRPTKVVFNSSADKEQILQRMQSLRTSEDEAERKKLENIHVAADRTFRQRADYRKLKQELDERTAAGEKDLVIRENKIVVKKPFRRRKPHEGQPD